MLDGLSFWLLKLGGARLFGVPLKVPVWDMVAEVAWEGLSLSVSISWAR